MKALPLVKICQLLQLIKLKLILNNKLQLILNHPTQLVLLLLFKTK